MTERMVRTFLLIIGWLIIVGMLLTIMARVERIERLVEPKPIKPIAVYESVK